PAECYSRFSGVLFTNDKFQVNSSKQKFMDLELKLKDKDTLFTPVFNATLVEKPPKNPRTKNLRQVDDDMQTKYINSAVDTFKFMATTPDGGLVEGAIRYHPFLYDRETYPQDVNLHQGPAEEIDDENESGTVNQARGKRDIFECFWNGRLIPYTTICQLLFVSRLPEMLNVEWPGGNPWGPNPIFPCGTPLGRLLLLSPLPILHSNNSNFLQNHEIKYIFSLLNSLTNLGKYTLTLKAVLYENNASVYGGRELPTYKHKFTIKEGNAENFTVGTMNQSVRVGVPFNIPLQMKDGYGHPTTPPPQLQPALQCSDLELSYETTSCSGNTFLIKGVKAKGKVQNYQQSRKMSHGKNNRNISLPVNKYYNTCVYFSGNPHSLHVKPEANPVKVENGNSVTFHVEVHDEAGNITANPKQIVRCQISGLPLVAIDCSSSGAGQIVTAPVNLKIINGEPQMLKAKFCMPNHVAAITTELKVMPSCRVSHMEVFSQGQETLKLKNKERIDWQAGGVLDNLIYKLYDESGREVQVTPEIAANVMVNWTGDVNRRALVKGRLPDVQVPTKVQEERFFQVSYQDQSVSFFLDQNQLKTDVNVNSVNLCVFMFKESSSSVAVTGVRFNPGTLGPRDVCFSYGEYTACVAIRVTAGIPAKLISLHFLICLQPLHIMNGHGIPKPFVVQLCDAWGNPSPDQRVVVEIRSPLTVLTSVISQPVDSEGKASFTVNTVKGSKGQYQLEFRGCFNRNPIPGPNVSFSVIPDPNKPVKLLVNYNTSARLPAGGTFPAFSVTVVCDNGSPMTTFNPADLSMWWWKGSSSPRPGTVIGFKSCKMCHLCVFSCRDKEIPQSTGTYTIQFSLQLTSGLFSALQISVNVEANQPVKLGSEHQLQTPVVSYSKDITSRLLVENVTLKIMDQHGNPAGQDLNGRVLVSIRCPEGQQSSSLPLFEWKTSTFHNNSRQTLAIMEDSPGENGSRYILSFKPEVTTAATHLSPFELPFHFCNGTAFKRSLMAELFCQSEKEHIERSSRRRCRIPNNFSGPNVLGKVGHLALIADDDAARVISWHLSGDMDCVITRTTAEAQRINREQSGRQQVLPLDGIFVNQANRPLPHIRNGRELFSPTGNPLFARNLLIYPCEEESCELVFKNLLGETILMDDIDSATNYRKAVSKRIPCPTILTRQGNRLSARGKFGGAQNTVPREFNNMFGAPLPQPYYSLLQEIDLLSQYQSVLLKKTEAEEEYSKLISKSHEMQQKQHKMDEIREQLKDIEKQLGKIHQTCTPAKFKVKLQSRREITYQMRKNTLQLIDNMAYSGKKQMFEIYGLT
uniref:Structural maintenance of chromosomes flexible hinge domain containing 1 n=1 Tax=Fundulus heteroclitus TaxID=8078 RepID=A0A3Q2PD81_FUNHE